MFNVICDGNNMTHKLIDEPLKTATQLHKLLDYKTITQNEFDQKRKSYTVTCKCDLICGIGV